MSETVDYSAAETEIKLAIEDDRAGRFDSAFRRYHDGCRLYLDASMHETDEAKRRGVESAVLLYIDRAKKLQRPAHELSKSRSASPSLTPLSIPTSPRSKSQGSIASQTSPLSPRHHALDLSALSGALSPRQTQHGSYPFPTAPSSPSKVVPSQSRRHSSVTSPSARRTSSSRPAPSRRPTDTESDDSDNRKLRQAIEQTIVTGSEKPVHWDDLIGIEAAKEALREAVVLPLRLPHLFGAASGRAAWRGILLYGPPGTGKTLIARACATEIGGAFFAVSASDLVSKWHGESERLVKVLFAMARERKPSVIFIDEIDAIAGRRSDGEAEGSRRLKTELMVQMNGFGDQSDVLVLAATNTPWQLDSAVLRRFDRRVYVPLPDEPARRAMFVKRLGSVANTLTQRDFDEVAKRTGGLSGSDITGIVRDALMRPVRRLTTATYFKRATINGKTGVLPCNVLDAGAFPATWQGFKPDEVLEPPLETRDLADAVRAATPTVSAREIDLHRQFAMTGMQ